ncbi:glycosyltransferase [Paenibacillus sp. MZ04-78.2]|uniref:glycosyltransferase family 2 protein n=1 Tax=Paenibacillus sp. MZ04-78.2 TaxID=2962034 RepID=UPI0020B88660|nr:glycosyltransferase family 2 protein [Paenibacillus sp. MZ04-78.2]MCP3776516.1 glycosyltransferase [Paenibacillus sp. MZ04-78.2]
MVRITVIIPTQNRPKDLQRCLYGLADNDLSLLEEVIVIDDGSQIPIAEVIQVPGLPVLVIRNEQPCGAAACRNIAGISAKSKIIAFLDDDAVPSPDWLKIIIQELKSDHGAITGRVLRFDKGLISQARQVRYNMRYTVVNKGQSVSFFSGGNSAIWTDLFQKVGGFNQHGSGGDNGLVADLSGQGYKVHFIPELVILHRNSKGLKKAMIEAYNSGRFHPEQLRFREALHKVVSIKAIVTDGTPLVAVFNWGLNLLHLIGRIQRKK